MSRCSFDKSFKTVVVKLMIEEGFSVKEVSEQLDLHTNSLYRWVQEVEKYGASAFPGKGSALFDAHYEIKNLNCKKGPSIFEAKQEIQFQFLKDNRETVNIQRADQTLNVSNSGFYEFLKRKPSKRKRDNQVLKEEIAMIFHEHHGRYGTIRITKVLKERGILVNRKHVGKLLHELRLYAEGSAYGYKYYNRKRSSLSQSNLINQIVVVTDRNKIWLGDITYVPLKKGTAIGRPYHSHRPGITIHQYQLLC